MKKQLYSFCLVILGSSAYSQTGVGTLSPNSLLEVRGAMATGIRIVTASATLGYTDHILIYTGTSNATATLPDASTCQGRIYWIKNASGTVPQPVLTVNTTSSQTIEGATSSDLDEPNEIIRVVSNGGNWEITSQDVPTAKTSSTGSSWNQGGNSLKSIKSVGTASNIDFPLITNNTEAMRISSAGFLGIGTNNPQGRIHVTNDNNDAGNDYALNDYMNGTGITQGIFEKKSAGTVASPGNLSNGDTIGQFRFVPRFAGSVDHSNGSGIDAVYKGDGTTALTDLRFFTSNSEAMRMNENGKLSIGTTTPDGNNPEKLLVDAGTTGSYNVISGKGEIDSYLQLNIQNKSNGNLASSDLVASADNGDETNNYIDLGVNSSQYSAGPSPILNSISQSYLYSTGADFVIGNSTPSQDLIFFNAGSVGYAATSERLRIASTGNVGIGQITVPGEKLVVAGIISPAVDDSYTLGTSTNRWSQLWATTAIQSSDARLKTNITPLNYGLHEVMIMKPVRYNWKSDPRGKKKIGLIAQQTQHIIPEVVKGDARKEKLGMNYAELVVVLVKSVQQQQEKIKELNNELTELSQQ